VRSWLPRRRSWPLKVDYTFKDSIYVLLNSCLRVAEAYSGGSRKKGEITQKHTLEALGSMHRRTQGVDKRANHDLPSGRRNGVLPSKHAPRCIAIVRFHAAATHRTRRHDRAQVGQSDIGEHACIHTRQFVLTLVTSPATRTGSRHSLGSLAPLQEAKGRRRRSSSMSSATERMKCLSLVTNYTIINKGN
jgi:hypothetical protein